MADFDRELRDIFEGIGKDISALRKALAGTNKSILNNTKNTNHHAASQKLMVSILRQHQKTLKDNNALTDELNEEIEDQIKAIENHTKSTKKASASQKGLTGMIMKTVKFLGKLILGAAQIGAQFGKTSSNIKGFTDAVEAGFDEIPGFGTALKKIAPEIDDNVQLFKGLAQSGASFGSSITRLRMAAYDAGMPLVQFQELIQNNSTALARLFGSVDDGVLEIVKLGRGLRQFQMDELAQFGITMEETNEFLTTFAEIERARGQAEGMTSARLLAGTQAYTKNLILLSKLTGQSVQELDKQQRALAADGAFQAKLAQMDSEQAERVRQAMNLLPASAQQAAKEIIGLGAPISDAAVGLQALSGGKFGEALQGIMDGTETDLIALSNTFKEMGSGIIKGGDAYASAALAGNSMMQETLNIAAAMAGRAADRESIEKQLLAAQQDNIVKAVNMTSALDKTTYEVQRLGTILLNTTLFDLNSPFGKLMAKYVDTEPTISKKVVDSFENWFGSWFKKERKKDQEPTDPNWVPPGTPGLALGTYGTTGKMFANFGTGTPVVLHGSEAVVPENSAFGDALKIATQMASSSNEDKKQTAMVNNNNNTNVVNNEATDRNTVGEKELVKIVESTTKNNNLLEQLIAVNMATERNTKLTKNSLDNMSGSLV